MARRMTMGKQLDAQALAYEQGIIAGKALAIALPSLPHASSTIDYSRALCEDLKLTGPAREEFIKGVAWGWTGKKYALPD